MSQARAACSWAILFACLLFLPGVVGCGDEPVKVDATAAALQTTVTTATQSAEDRLRLRAEELLALLTSVDQTTPEIVAAIESLLVPENAAFERAGELAARNAASDSTGLAPDEVIEVFVAADGVSGVTRVKDHYREQDGQPSEALVDIDWRLVDGEWYRTLDNGRAAEGPIG